MSTYTQEDAHACANCFGVKSGDARWGECCLYDLNNDGVISQDDWMIIVGRIGVVTKPEPKPRFWILVVVVVIVLLILLWLWKG